MLVLAGDPYGQLHSINPYSREQLDTYGELTKQCPVKLICCSSPNNIYFASSNKIMNWCGEQHTEIQLKSSASLIGLAVNEVDRLLYSYSDGTICDFNDVRGENSDENTIFEMSKDEGWLRGWQSPYKPHEYCMIGRSIPPVIVDLAMEVVSWSAKNVPNDELELKVPVFDVDGLCYNEGNNLAALHKDRKLRLYDVKKGQRRPILDKEFTEEKTNFTTMAQSSCQNYFLMGNAQGSVFVSDRRKELKVCGKLKGANGALKSIAVLPNGYVLTGSLDSYVRLYNLSDNKLVSSIYMGHPVYSLYASGEVDEQQLEDAKEQQAEAPKQKAPKRKNTVALPYLQPRKLQKKQEPADHLKDEPVSERH